MRTGVVVVSIAALLVVPAGTAREATAACRTAEVTAAAPRLDLFARGPDNALWHRWWVQGSPWTCWQNLLGELTSAPAVTSHLDGVLHVVARGAKAV